MEQKHVDAIMRGVQGPSEKVQVERFRSLSMRMGVAGLLAKTWLAKLQDVKDRPVAKLIEFYIPTRIPKRVKWLPPQQPGKVIEFPVSPKRTA
jgi:hypothetical protein